MNHLKANSPLRGYGELFRVASICVALSLEVTVNPMVAQLVYSTDAPTTCPLTVATAAAANEDHYLAVLDPRQRCVVVFDVNGRPHRVIGRGGEGPGEFRSAHALGTLGDSLWVSDGQLNRLTFFDWGGRMRGTAPANEGARTTSTASAAVVLSLLFDGTAIIQPVVMSSMVPDVLVYLRRSRDTHIEDTVLKQDPRRELLRVVVAQNGGGLYGQQPLRSGPLFGVSSDGRWFAVLELPKPGVVAVRRVDVARGRAEVVRLNYSPAKIPTRVIDSVVTGMVGRMRSRPPLNSRPESELRKAVREALYVPDYLQPVDKVTVGKDGTVWLGALPRRGYWTGIRPSGKTVEVSGPARGTMLEANERFIWFVTYDKDDVPAIVRHDR